MGNVHNTKFISTVNYLNVKTSHAIHNRIILCAGRFDQLSFSHSQFVIQIELNRIKCIFVLFLKLPVTFNRDISCVPAMKIYTTLTTTMIQVLFYIIISCKPLFVINKHLALIHDKTLDISSTITLHRKDIGFSICHNHIFNRITKGTQI